MISRQLAELVLEALETGYIEALALSALEDINEGESNRAEPLDDDGEYT